MDYYVATGQTSSPAPSALAPATSIAQNASPYRDYYAGTTRTTTPSSASTSAVAHTTGRYRDYYASQATAQTAMGVAQATAPAPREAVAVNVPK
jgi:hypothetical protein